MIKKILLICLIIGIFQMSNTPNLKVDTPSTWVNTTEYEKDLPIKKFFSLEGDFFYKYENVMYLNFFLHKISHIFFFGLLAYLAYLNFNKKYLLSWLFVVFFATLDEIHQSFVVGRSGRALDILVDSTSAFLVLFFVFLYKKRRTKNKKNV